MKAIIKRTPGLFDEHALLTNFAFISVIKTRANQVARQNLVPHLIVMGVISPEKSNMAIDRTICFKENYIALLSQSAIQHIGNCIEVIYLTARVNCITIPAPRIDIAAAAGPRAPRSMVVVGCDCINVYAERFKYMGNKTVQFIPV